MPTMINGGFTMNLENNSIILDAIVKNPDRHRAYLDLAHEYMTRDQSFRDMVTQGWDFNVEWKFLNGCRRASKNNDAGSPEISIRTGLLYYSIAEKNSRDVRDDLMGIAICYHSCLAAGIDPNEMFRSVAEVSTPKVRKLLIDFIERPDEKKSMKAFRLVRIDDENGDIVIKADWWK